MRGRERERGERERGEREREGREERENCLIDGVRAHLARLGAALNDRLNSQVGLDKGLPKSMGLRL